MLAAVPRPPFAIATAGLVVLLLVRPASVPVIRVVSIDDAPAVPLLNVDRPDTDRAMVIVPLDTNDHCVVDPSR
jgi:hypothetical protein